MFGKANKKSHEKMQTVCFREALKKCGLNMSCFFFQRGGFDQTKSFEALFFASKPPKGGGSEQIQKF